MEPIVVKTKSEMAFEALQEMILSGQIEQQRVYSVAELEDMLQISRTPLARALARLEEQGVVELVAKAGFRVMPLQSADLEEHSLLVTQVAKLVVEWVIQRAAPESLETLWEVSREIRSAIGRQNQGRYFSAYRDFHLKLCDIAKASHCRRFFEQNWNYEGWYCYRLAENEGALLELLEDHEALIRAMEEKNLPLAIQICDEHSARCIQLLRQNVS